MTIQARAAQLETSQVWTAAHQIPVPAPTEYAKSVHGWLTGYGELGTEHIFGPQEKGHGKGSRLTLEQVSAQVMLKLLTGAVTGGQDRFATVESAYRAFAASLGMTMEEALARTGKAVWERLGWTTREIQKEELPDYGSVLFGKIPDPYAEMEHRVRELCARLGIPTVGLAAKNRSVAWAVTDSVRLLLPEWRMADFVFPTYYREYDLITQGLRVVKGSQELGLSDDSVLGDGTYARVHPTRLAGFDASTIPEGSYTAIQTRGFSIRKSGDGGLECPLAFKGLIIVDPSLTPEEECICVGSGYGDRKAVHGDQFIVLEMNDAARMNSNGRVGIQFLYYNGAPRCHNRFSVGGTLTFDDSQASDVLRQYLPEQDRDWHKAVLAGAESQWMSFPFWEQVLSTSKSSVTQINCGQRRYAVAGMSHGKSQHAHKLAPYEFKAPYALRALFRVGERYLIARDPALPDATSAFSAVCVGYTKANVFVVPTLADPYTRARADELGTGKHGVWEQCGGDFDGDTALVFQHHSRGGPLMGLNDLPEETRKALAESSGREADRKQGTKRDFVSGFERWVYMLTAQMELGLFDVHARKLIDLYGFAEGRIKAASIASSIQRAVDRQKRLYSYDGLAPRELRKLPKATYLTSVLRDVKKPKSDLAEDRTSTEHSWNLIMEGYMSMKTLSQGPSDGTAFHYPCEEFVRALQPAAAAHCALVETACHSMFGKHVSPKHGLSPRSQAFPRKEIAAWREQQEPANPELATLLAMLDKTRKQRNTNKALVRLLREWAAATGNSAGMAVASSNDIDLTRFMTQEQAAEIYAPSQERFAVQNVLASKKFIVARKGEEWTLSPLGFRNMCPVVLAGNEYPAGSVELVRFRARNRSAVALRINGVDSARVWGQLSKTSLRELLKMLVIQLESAMPSAEELDELSKPADTAEWTLDEADHDGYVPEQYEPVNEFDMTVLDMAPDAPDTPVREYGEQYLDAEPVWEDAPLFD